MGKLRCVWIIILTLCLVVICYYLNRVNLDPEIMILKNISHTEPTFNSTLEQQILQSALESVPPNMTTANQATSPYTCSYHLQNQRKDCTVGDVITVVITARDYLKNPKTCAGDFFQAMLFNEEKKASVFGQVVDHKNGTYTVTFELLWEGQAKVSVRLIHSSEAVENPVNLDPEIMILSTLKNTSHTEPTFNSSSEQQILESALEWPVPPNMTTANQATSPYTCSYHLQNQRKDYTVGDVIMVVITAGDYLRNPKTYGGDFFQAKLFNKEKKASVFGQVVDHKNGTYTVTFKLLWEGQAKVSVRLIHSSEAVEVLLRHREQEPDKVYFLGVFKSGDQAETVVCNAQCSEKMLDSSSHCCEYSDPIFGEKWFCQKPKRLPCSAWVHHSFGGYHAHLSTLESTLLSRNFTNVVLPGDVTLNVSEHSPSQSEKHVKCVPGLETPSPAGFYWEDKWTSFVCHAQSFPSAEKITACLKDKQVLMMGDSTLRQWYEYLLKTVPSLKQLNLYTSSKSGPFEAVDTNNNIRLVWRAHGLPLRTSLTPKADMHYITFELEGLAGGPHSVVVFTIWAHFTTFPLSTYLQRLAGIRSSIQALLLRAPQTLVVIKSANTGYKDIYGSDWLSWQLDSALRIMFRALPVVIIDVWQMTSCHYSPDDIHPPPTVIKNEVDLFLSFVCPT